MRPSPRDAPAGSLRKVTAIVAVAVVIVATVGAAPIDLATADASSLVLTDDHVRSGTALSGTVDDGAANDGNKLFVSLDANGNGIYDDGEPSVSITSVDGSTGLAWSGLSTAGLADGVYTIYATESNNLKKNDPLTGATAMVRVDDTAPTISGYRVTNPSGRQVRVEFNASEQLSAIAVAVSGAESATLSTSDFTESGTGPYTYVATYAGGTDGEYTATLGTAADGAGNDGAGGESGTVSVVLDTTPPDLQAAETVDANDDGTVESLLVTYTEPIDDATVAAGDFSVAGATVTDVSTGSSADDDRSLLAVSGLVARDTSVTPDVTLAANGVADLAGNAGPTTDSTVIATDAAPPVIVAAETGDVDGDGQVDRIEVTFSEPVPATGTAAADYDVGGGYVGETLDGAEDDGDAVLAIDVAESGTPDTDATPAVTYTQGTTTDAVGNPAVSQTFSTSVDGAAPVLVVVAPPDDATAVSTGTVLGLTFSEPPVVGSGAVVVRNASDDGVFESIDVAHPGYVGVSGDTATVDPPTDLRSKRGYYVLVDGTAFEDVAGNAFAGVSNATAWNFETADDRAPAVTVLQPDGGEALRGGQSYELQWTATDDQAVAANSVDIAYSVDGGATWAPIATGEANDGRYSWSVPTVDESSALVRVNATDTSGNLGSDVSDAVFSIDATPPDLQAAATADANGDGTVDRIELTFTEAVEDATLDPADFSVGGATVTGVTTGSAADDHEAVLLVTDLPGGDTSVTPDVALAADALADRAGNSGPTASTTVTAADEAPPAVLSATTGDADGDGRIDRVAVVFSEGVTAASTDAADYDVLGGAHTNEVLSSDDGDATLLVGFDEGTSPDTGTKPDVVYTRGTTADAAGNLLASVTVTDTADGAPPVVVGTTPLDGATNVSLTTDLTATFSEVVVAGAGNVTVYRASDDTVQEAAAVTGPAVAVSGSTLTLDPTNNLPPSRAFYVLIDATAVDDAAGNDFAGIASTSAWTFRTAVDSAPPAVAVTAPNGGESLRGGAIHGIEWTATDDQGVAANSIEIDYSVDGGASWAPIATGEANDGRYSWSVPALDTSTALVRINATDTSDNLASDTSDSTFAIDSTGPELVGAETVDGDLDGTVDAITVTLDEAVDDGSVDASDFTVAGASVDAVTTGSAADDDAVRLAVSGLPVDDTAVTPDVSLSAGSVTDLAGNGGPPAAATVTASDATAPIITAATTGDVDADGRIDRLNVTFSEGVTAASTDAADYDVGGGAYGGETIVAHDHGDAHLLLAFEEAGSEDSDATPALAYTQGTTADVSGNLAPSQSFTATTDGAPPALRSTSPVDGATNVSVSTNGTLSFSEPVVEGTGSIVIRRSADDGVVETLAATGERVQVAGTEVTLDPSADLASKTEYHVLVDATAFQDVGGNAFPGIDDPATWHFETADEDAPTVTVIAPNGGESLRGGAIHGITWTATDDQGVAANSIEIDYSDDGGTTWSTVATGEANDGRYDWLAPSTDAEDSRIRIRAADAGGNVGADTSDASFAVDSTGPEVAAAATADPDGDGTVDRVVVTASEALEDSSLDASDVTVDGATVTGVSTGATANDRTVVLAVSGLPSGDTAVRPQVAVAASGLTDLAGNDGPNATASLTASDGAAPVVTAARTGDADEDGRIDRVAVTFSEPLVPASVRATDFDVGGASYDGETIEAFADGDRTLTLGTNEGTGSDTGATPSVEYARGTSADAAGNLLADATFGGTTDAVAPVLTLGTAAADGTGFDVDASLSEPGTVGSVVVADGAAAPSADQVGAGRDATGDAARAAGRIVVSTSGTVFSDDVDGLAAATAYDVYAVAEDGAGNRRLPVQRVDARTGQQSDGSGGGGTVDGPRATARLATDEVVVAVDNLRAGRSASTTLRGLTSGAITYERMRFDIAEAGPDVRVTLAPNRREAGDPPIADATILQYFVVARGGTVESPFSSVELTVRIDPVALPSGASPDEVEFYRFHDGAWDRLESSRDGERYVVSLPGLSSFAIALPAAGGGQTPTPTPTGTPPGETPSTATPPAPTPTGTPPPGGIEPAGNPVWALGVGILGLAGLLLIGRLLGDG